MKRILCRLSVQLGAGDNFNAGVVFGLLKYRIRRDDLDELSEDDWDHVIRCGKDFSADVCMSLNNSISKEFAAKLTNKIKKLHFFFLYNH